MAFSFLIFNFWKTGKIEAAPELKDVFGWAWSENIGWIHFKGAIPKLDLNGLAAGYTLNEGTGTKIYDSSPNGNNGDLYNGPTWTTWGSEPYPYNTALKFDGVDDQARVPNSGSLNLQNAISIEAWIKGQAVGFTKSQKVAGGSFSPQLQVVGDKIYYVWVTNNQIWRGEMNTDGSGWSATQRTTTATNKWEPQLQVVGDKIYYVWSESKVVAGVLVSSIWLDASTWSQPKKISVLSNFPQSNPQLQVVKEAGNTYIYVVWWGNNGYSQYPLYTGKLDENGSWIWGPNALDPAIHVIDNRSPQFQIVGSNIYYIFYCDGDICVGKMNTNGGGWTWNDKTFTNSIEETNPQLQVVGSKIYYVWLSQNQIWTGEMNTDGTGWSATKRTTTATDTYYPQLQVVGDKIYYVWHEGGKIMTAESDLGSVAPLNPVDRGWGNSLQFQVVGSKSYFIWEDSNNIYTGEMNSNLINKGDFYGLGVKDGKVMGFINAGVDGFKYKGEAISDTAGATVGLNLPDSTNWHHFVMTYDKTNLKLYLDGGTLAGGQEISVPYNATINTNLFPLIIGDDFNGTIDEIRVYNRALTAAEILDHFEGDSYGVKIDDSTGYFSGYAWSEHIGWIQFDPPGDFITYPVCGYPSSPCQPAKLDLTPTGTVCGGAGWVCGWARALVDGGGWDGWIKLRGTATNGSPYGIWLDTSISPHQFRNFAWGSDVVGWISFNCSNRGVCTSGTAEGGPSDYKVKTSLSLNFKPNVSNAQIVTGPSYCTQTLDSNSIQKGQVGFSWTYTDNEGDDQERYWLQIATDPSFAPASLVINCQVIKPVVVDPNTPTTITSQLVDIVSSGSTELANTCNDGGELGTRKLAISYNGSTYYWRVASKAATGNTSWSDPAEGPSFTTPSHAKPYVDFQWCPLKPAASEFTQFCSIEEATKCETTAICVNASSPSPPPSPDVTCYNSAGEVDCPFGVPGKGWAWTFTDANLATSTDKNPLVRFSSKGFKDVSLTVTDADSLSCTMTRTVSVAVEYPLPQWKEIPPTF